MYGNPYAGLEVNKIRSGGALKNRQKYVVPVKSLAETTMKINVLNEYIDIATDNEYSFSQQVHLNMAGQGAGQGAGNKVGSL